NFLLLDYSRSPTSTLFPYTTLFRSEIYLDESAPPPSLLQAAIASGHSSFERCVVFHSLSKRSSVPGLRSGFVAGDPRILRSFLRSEEHTSELQSRENLVCRLLLEKK